MTQDQPNASADTTTACERMPYQEMTDPAFGQRAADTFVASRTADRAISLVGPCPRCSSGMEVVIPGEMFLATRTSLLRRALGRPDGTASPAGSQEEEVPMICLCTATHPGRPEGRKGCGAYWNLTVEDRP
jgi:hypothetical protein